MKIVGKIDQTREIIEFWKRQGFSIGFVPTMGYLHEGHKSLIQKAVEENDKVVVSIFVNPMQFGPKEDFTQYPRDLEQDKILCEAIGTNLIFHPEVSEIYKQNFSSFVDVTGLTKELCGKSRPTHFRGVCTIVSKLFHIVNPDRAYFGQKDAQQLVVVKQMVQDLNMNIQIIGCPIVREKDGLAISSRNVYLNKEERKSATILYETLEKTRERMESGETDVAAIIDVMKEHINKRPLAKLDYLEIVDSDNLKPIEVVKGSVLIAIAVYIGKTRLIDNLIWQQENSQIL